MIGQVMPIMRSNTDTGNVKIFFIIVFFCIQPPVLDRGLLQYRQAERRTIQSARRVSTSANREPAPQRPMISVIGSGEPSCRALVIELARAPRPNWQAT